MPIDSDLQNPDGQLEVKFYLYQGEGMWNGVPHVRIIAPGDANNINDRPASDQDKRRFQRQWLNFQADSNEGQIVGTPLTAWRKDRPDQITDGQLQELLILKFMSVDQLAMASDSQLQRIMGGVGLRQTARSYLSSKNAQASGAELEKAKDELLMMQTNMARMEAMMLEMKNAAPQEKSYRAGAARRGGGGWNKGKKFSKKVIDANPAAPAGDTSL